MTLTEESAVAAAIVGDSGSPNGGEGDSGCDGDAPGGLFRVRVARADAR